MSVVFNADGEFLRRDTGLVASTDDYTCTFWYKPTATPSGGDKRVLFLNCNTLATYDRYVGLTTATNSNVLYLTLNTNGTPKSSSISPNVPLTLNMYNAIAYVRSGTTHTAFLNTWPTGQTTGDISGVTFTDLTLNGDSTASIEPNAQIQGFREWNAALTLTELLAEWNSSTAVRTSGLFTDCPLSNTLGDVSGNGHTLTSVGSVTFTTSATNVPLTNTLSATPFTVIKDTDYIQAVGVGGSTLGQVKTVYFKYDAVSGDNCISMWCYGDTLYYRPRWLVYSDPGYSSSLEAGSVNAPIVVPVSAATSYYLRVSTYPGNPTGIGALYINLQNCQNPTIPIGSIIITEDNGIAQVSLINGTTGVISSYRQPVAGGSDAVVTADNQYNIIQGAANVYFYDNQLQFISSITKAEMGLSTIFKLGSNNVDRIYVSGGLSFAIIDPQGNVIQSAVDTGLAINELEVNTTGDTLYLVVGTLGPIKTWNLNTSTVGPDFATNPTGARITPAILVTTTGDVIVKYWFTTTQNGYMARYDSAGVLQTTYDSPNTSSIGYIDLLTFGTTGATFWEWQHFGATTAGQFSRFREIRISDGSVLQNFTSTVFISGSSENQGNTTSPVRFGHDFTCPFIVTKQQIEALGATTGTLIVSKSVVPLDNDIEFNFEAGGGLSPTEFSLSNGNSFQFDDVPAGDGYSIVEVSTTGYSSAITISNGSPANNISIGAGETVVVSVINTAINPLSGVYKYDTTKRNDTVYAHIDAIPPNVVQTQEKKIPNPFIIGPLIGDD